MKDMNEKEILRHVDHTLLSQEAVWDEIRQVCERLRDDCRKGI